MEQFPDGSPSTMMRSAITASGFLQPEWLELATWNRLYKRSDKTGTRGTYSMERAVSDFPASFSQYRTNLSSMSLVSG